MRYAPLIDSFGRQATYGARQWFGRVGNRFAGVTLLGKGEGGGVLKAYYASGREMPEFDSTGARNWKYHTSDDATESGPPELIAGLPTFKPKGRSWVEWLVPAELSEGSETEPEDILWIINGLKVHDYTYSGGLLVQGSKIVSANNALVTLFIATQRMGLPLTRFHKWGQSWIDFKDRCAATISFAGGSGLLGQYYSDATLTTLVHTRNEPYLDRDWDYVSPAPDVPAAPFSARFTGKVKPTHTGTWTFYARYDDGCRLWVNGVQLVNDWTTGAMRESSGTISLTANVEYDIVAEYFQQELLGGLHLSWSHASVPKATVPQSALIPPSRNTERFNAHVAFPQGTPALVAFNSVFRRAPGVSWQDVNGAIRVVSTPDRPVTHRFTYDPTQDSVLPNILDGSFSLKPASREDRPDYLIVSYSDLEDPFFTERTVAADRRVDPTKPPRNPVGPVPVGVATHSLASRIAETEMNVLHLNYPVRLSGFASSHKVAKGDVVECSHDVTGVRESAPTKLFVTEERFDSPTRTADARSFLARLHDANWYSDSGYVPLTARIVSDIPSPFVPPPPVTSVSLVQFNRFLPDDTHVPVVQGLAQFAAFSHPQRGRVYWKRPRRAFTFDPATGTFTAVGHGMPNGTKVELFNSGGALPAGFSAATAYFVVGAAQNSFQLAATSGGAAINGTTAGSGTNEVREYDFTPTNIIVTPDPSTLQGAFEVENVPRGANDFKVVSESLKGVTRGAANAAAYSFTVSPLAAAPDVSGVTLALKNRVFVTSWTALDPTLYPDLVAYVVYDETGAEIGRTRDNNYTDYRLPTGTQVTTYTAERRVKALLRGNRRSANFATGALTLKRLSAPSYSLAMAQPQTVRVHVTRAVADTREEILETVVQIINPGTLAVIDTLTLDGDVRQFDLTANFSAYPSVKLSISYRHVAPVITDGLATVTSTFNFSALAPADLPTATAAAKGAVQTTTATPTAVSTDDPRMGAASDTQAGLVSTGAQSFGGEKTFLAKLKVVTASGVFYALPAPGEHGGHLELLAHGGLFGLLEGVLSSGRAFLQAQRVDGVGTVYDLLLNPNGGKVGIGNAAPSAKLEVNGSARYAATTDIPGATGVGDGLELWYYSGAGGPYALVLSYNRDTNAYKPLLLAGSYISFRQGASERLRVHTDGNIGIDTASPTERLDVNGKIKVRTGVAQGGGIKHGRVTGTAAAGGNTAFVFNYAENFADTNYTVAPGLSGNGFLDCEIVNMTLAVDKVSVMVKNSGASDRTVTVHVIAMHD